MESIHELSAFKVSVFLALAIEGALAGVAIWRIWGLLE
jgi:hypothetical protein